MSSTTLAIDPGWAAQDQSWIVVTAVSIVMSLAILIVSLRIYTRVYLLKHLGWDDYCVLLTLVVVMVDAGFVFSLIPYGLGRHMTTVDPALLTTYMRNFWASIVFYNLSLAMVKLTFLLQYKRVLSVHKMSKVITYVGVVIMLWATSQILVTVFTCTPVQKFWDSSLEGQCVPNLPFWYINAAGNIISDLAIFIMPLPVLSKLQLRKKQKYFLMGIFSLGFFTCAISLIRLAWLKQGGDFTFENVPTSCWSVSEVVCGILCACLPTLRPLMTKIKPRWMVSYATRGRHLAYAADGMPQYGPGAQGKAGFKLSSGVHRHSTPDSDTTLTSKNKNYSRLDDADLESVMPIPTSVSPVLKKSESSEPVNIFVDMASRAPSDHGAIAVQQLQLPPKQNPKGKAATSANDKAMSILGVGQPDVGISTRVMAGKSKPFSSIRGEHLGGIEVQRSVVVTTAPIDGSEENWGTEDYRGYHGPRR